MLSVMGSLKTAADLLEIYQAAKAAYLKALPSASHTVATGAGSRTQVNQNLKDLEDAMNKAEREYQALTGGGIANYAVTPSP